MLQLRIYKNVIMTIVMTVGTDPHQQYWTKKQIRQK